MNNQLDNHEDDDRTGHRDREITLGTSMVLGIFFALAIENAVVLGFGYSMGSRHSATVAAAPVDPATGRTFAGFKPAPGSPITTSKPTDAYSEAAPPATTVIKTLPLSSGTKAPPEAFAPDQPSPAPTRVARAETSAPPLPPVGAPVPSAPATPGATQFVVQVAAATRQEDAELVLSTLKRRNYNVVIRQEPQDKLFHVQVGPFPTKKDADAMRQRLLADGFNAYIK